MDTNYQCLLDWSCIYISLFARCGKIGISRDLRPTAAHVLSRRLARVSDLVSDPDPFVSRRQNKMHVHLETQTRTVVVHDAHDVFAEDI